MHSQEAKEVPCIKPPPPSYPYIGHFPLPPHSLTIPSSLSRSVHTDAGSCQQLTYASDRRCGLIDVAHKGQEGHTTARTA